MKVFLESFLFDTRIGPNYVFWVDAGAKMSFAIDKKKVGELKIFRRRNRRYLPNWSRQMIVVDSLVFIIHMLLKIDLHVCRAY